nr:DNA excision repair protein ERCC-8 [Tanacetum cinerariifolium]
VDLTDGRYLISGASNASLAIYDIQRAIEYHHHINVWDTNTTQVVIDFKMPGKVYRTAMSSLATSHTLIASATEDV